MVKCSFSVLCLKFSVYKVCLYSSGCARFGLSAVLHITQHCSCGGLICGFPLWVSLCVCCEQRTIVDLHPSISHTMIRFTTRCIETCAYHEITLMWITCFFPLCCPFSGRWYFKIFKFKMSRFLDRWLSKKVLQKCNELFRWGSIFIVLQKPYLCTKHW